MSLNITKQNQAGRFIAFSYRKPKTSTITNKFITLKIVSNGKCSSTVVYVPNADMHYDILQFVREDSGLDFKNGDKYILNGGGRMSIDSEKKEIVLFGKSLDYEVYNKKTTIKVLEEAFSGYHIIEKIEISENRQQILESMS